MDTSSLMPNGLDFHDWRRISFIIMCLGIPGGFGTAFELPPDRFKQKKRKGGQMEQVRKQKQTRKNQIKNQSRRYVMSASRFTLIGLMAIAVMVAGCSEKSIVGPDQAENFSGKAIKSGPRAEELDHQAMDNGSKRIYKTLLVTAHKVDVEGGCWYIKEEGGKVFEPAFNEKCVNLKEGMKLKVYGWVDLGLASYCMIGPIFRIEHYTILPVNDGTASTLKRSDSYMSSGKAADVVAKKSTANTDKQPAPSDALRGFYNATEEGCMFIENKKGVIAELNFTKGVCPNIAKGALITVWGSYSLLAWSPCQLAPVFNVNTFEVVDVDKIDGDDKTPDDSELTASAAADNEEDPYDPDDRIYTLTHKEISQRNRF